MEWNWCWNGNGNDMTSFMLYESSGDSEEVVKLINDHHHHHGQYSCHDHQATMINGYEEEGVFFRYDDIEDVAINDVEEEDDDDDAQSCSYDHSFYINTSYGNSHHDDDDNQSSKMLYDVISDVDDDDDDDDDDDYKNWGESKLMDSSKKKNRSHKFCGNHSLNQRDADKQFWESCLAS